MNEANAFMGKGENEEDVKIDEKEIKKEKDNDSSKEGKLSKSQNIWISLFKVLIDPKFMENEEIYDFNDEINKIDLHIDILEAVKFFKLLLDENGNIRQDISNEQLESAKFKILKVLKYVIMSMANDDDMRYIVYLLKNLDCQKDAPSLYPQLYPYVTPNPIKGW